MGSISNVFKIASLGAFLASTAFALPKASDLVADMGMGINIGNTMEVPASAGGPTGWGNLFPTAEYVKSLKDAGFGTVRIPCAWDSHASNGTINSGWLDSVKAVVDMVIDNGMYAVLNSHWDNGWLEDKVFSGSHIDRDGKQTTTDSSAVRKLQEGYWTQIANKFKDYDEKLIFASANEPGVNDHRGGSAADGYTDNGQLAFNADRMVILKRLHEACLRAVRNTGGNNATRTVIVQMPRTEIDKMTLLQNDYPTDPAGTGYTMAEAHFYPYQLTLMTQDESWGKVFYYWEDLTPGNDAAHTCSGSLLGSKASVDEQFNKLQTAFVNNGIPVVIGEMGSIKRLSDLEGNNLKLHLQSRAAWYGYTLAAAKARGIVPIVWDTGDEGNGNMTIIRRQTHKFGGKVGEITDYETLNAMREAYGMSALEGNSIDQFVAASQDTSNKSAVITYTSATTDSVETGTVRIDLGGKNWSQYTAISFKAKIEGEAKEIPSDPYAWAGLDFFAMSGSSWGWSDYHVVQEIPKSGTWEEYKIPFGASGIELTDQSNVMAIGWNVYGTNFNGTMAIDNVVLWKADGTTDTLENFNKKVPSVDGIASATLKPTESLGGNINAISNVPTLSNKIRLNVQNNVINVSFETSNAGKASVLLLNSLGQVVKSVSLNAIKGVNNISIESSYQGAAYLSVKQGNKHFVKSLILK